MAGYDRVEPIDPHNSNGGDMTGKDRDSYIISPDETVLVTGANGFVGSRVVRTLLTYGFKRVRCLVRPTSNPKSIDALCKEFGEANIELIRGNLLSPYDCLRAAEGASVIYHLAAGIEKSFPGCFLNSVVTTRNLLDAALSGDSLKRFVNTSSIAVYSTESVPPGGVLDEKAEIDDTNHLIERHEAYTYGKAKQDELVIRYGKEHGLPYVIVRPSVVFGPGKAKITDRVGTGTFGIFLHLGLGNRVPLTYVDNCAEAIVLGGLKEGVQGEVFNILDDDLPTSSEFLRLYKHNVRRFLSIPVPYRGWYLFCALWEKYSRWSEGQLPPVFNRRVCETYWKRIEYSNNKAKELLGWRPRTCMKDALNNFFAYVREAENRK